MAAENLQSDIASFRFRNLHPLVCMGTASDRYAGWLGQIYSPTRYQGRQTRRTHKVGNASFVEEVLPVASVEEYFHHFSVLEIDYTFYQLLLKPDGSPTRSYHVLKNYVEFLHSNDLLILKVPQAITAQKVRKGRQYIHNPTYLDPTLFTSSFYEPAIELLGASLRGFVFEQEYQRTQDRVPADQLSVELDDFFSAIPQDSRYHLELRTEPYLTPGLFTMLEHHGVGQVLSHWTWLPSLKRQFNKAGQRFLNHGKQCIIRLLTPRGMRYQDAYAMAHPFDSMVEGMMQPTMVDETISLTTIGVEHGITMNIILNNRAGGNAPLIAQQIARRFMDLGS
jgi:hypothetical protein